MQVPSPAPGGSDAGGLGWVRAEVQNLRLLSRAPGSPSAGGPGALSGEAQLHGVEGAERRRSGSSICQYE